MKHDIINRIIKETESTKYLEIGFGNGYNFNKIKCEKKEACDPFFEDDLYNVLNETSDIFFDLNNSDIDVVFIDGDHTAEQVRRDIINSLKCNPKAIILHDTIPHDKAMQQVPRDSKQWTGDVWRAIVGFKQSYPDVKVETYRSDFGLTVIYPAGKKVRKHFENTEMLFEDFKKNEIELLNIID